jgi:hypothetical protein
VSIRYAKYLTCVGGWTCYLVIEARDWTGAARAPRIKNWPCQHGKKHTVFTKPVTEVRRDSGRNRTYEAGVTVFGVGLWSRSGYSESASLRVEFDARRDVKHNRFCVGGSTDSWNKAKTLYVSTWRR